MENKFTKFLTKLSSKIVSWRFIIYGIFAIAVGFSLYGMTKVTVNNDMASYLPKESETSKALDIMSTEFLDYGTTDIMIKNTTVEETEQIITTIENIDHVSSVSFNSSTNYVDGKSLFTVTLDVAGDTDEAKTAVKEIRNSLEDYDIALRGSTAHTQMFSEMIGTQMIIILAIAIVIILSVLTFTSKSFFEIPIFLIVFIVAAILNMGTNFLLGSISFITNSVAVILQLALAIDYAIILAHRYSEESATKEPKEAVISALAKSIPSVLASALTTISGLIAIMFMQFRMGFDIGIVLTKGIICSFLTVFILMPGILYSFSKLIKKTKHKNFVPSVEKPSKAIVTKGRKFIPFIGLALIICGIVGQSFTRYTYDNSIYPTSKTTAYNQGLKEIEATFGASSMQIGIIVDSKEYRESGDISGHYKAEQEIANLVEEKFGKNNGGIVDSIISFGSITGGQDPFAYKTISETNSLISSIGDFALKNGMISGSIGDYRQQLTVVYVLYSQYIGESTGVLSQYKVPLFDSEERLGLLSFITDEIQSDIVNEETKTLINTLKAAVPQMTRLLESERYSRILVSVIPGMKSEDEATYSLIQGLRDELHQTNYYSETLVFGDSVSYYDIAQSFESDRLLVSLLTIAFILLILIFSFRSISLPVILVLVIQGAIWINFAIYAALGIPMLFMSYLIVSAINMGATIDYAIIVTNRYRELRDQGIGKVDAGYKSVSASFPSIMTSSLIMIIAGFVIGIVSSEPYIFTIGLILGSGTIISLILVLLLLPAVLVNLDVVIQKTTLGGTKWTRLEKEKETLESTDEIVEELNVEE